MRTFNVSDDIIPIGEFKTRISKWLKTINQTKHPLIITQNGRPAGVLLSPSEYDELVHRRLFLNSVNRRLSDIESGNVYNTKELKEELKERRSLRNSKWQ